MKTRLFKGKDERDQDLIRENFKKAVGFRKDLTAILDEDIEAVYAGMRDDGWLDNSNWPVLQAEAIGKVKALKSIISLINEKV